MSVELNRLKILAFHVKNMRRAQRQFFGISGHLKENKRAALKVAKESEARIDAFLKQLEMEKLI